MRGPALEDLLVAKRHAVRAMVAREARGLLRYQSVEDLTQAVVVRALENREQFEYRGDDAFVGWVFTLGRNVLSDRRDHWSALKRRSGVLLRYTASVAASDDPRAVAEPSAEIAGPSTFAARREQIILATRALDLLLPRDRKLVVWSSEGVDIDEQAERLGLSYAAVTQARRRALERLRKSYELVSRREGRSG